VTLWTVLLPVAGLGFPIVVLVLVVIGVLRAMTTRRLLPTRRSERWIQLGLGFGCAAMVTYSAGLWLGHFLDFRSADEVCGGPHASASTARPFPLSQSCHLADQTTRELVPAAVNPVFLLMVTGSVFSLVMSGRSGRPTPDQPGARPFTGCRGLSDRCRTASG
jgi:hypothetical protein